MAEQSVQGRIHSVFWEKLPIPLRGADWFRKVLERAPTSPAPKLFVVLTCCAKMWEGFRNTVSIGPGYI